MDSDKDLLVSRVSENREELQARFQEWGYLYFQNAVDKTKCDAVLTAILGELDPHISRDTNTAKPILNGEPFFETDPVWDAVYPRIQSLEAFHGLFHDASMLELMQIVAGENVFVYPIKMARISTPRKIGYETPPHQDAHSHRAGPTMAGIWVALHEVSREVGRVKVLPGSHKQGVRQVYSAEGVGGVQCEIFPGETSWHVSDFDQGDVLIFHSRTVHRAEPNTTERAVRISVDTRFCDHGAPVFSTNLEPHHGWRIEGLCWEQIYQGWQREELQYYWADYPNLF